MLSWIFIKRTDRQGWFRIAVTIFAITLSMATMLSVLAIGEATIKNSARSNFSRIPFDNNFRSQKTIDPNADELVIRRSETEYQKKQILELGIKQLTAKAPLPPGLVRQPATNEVFISPALAELIQQNPILEKRFAGFKIITAVPNQILSSPDQLMAIYQLPPAALEQNPELNLAFINRQQLANYQPTANPKMAFIIKTFMTLCGLGLIFPLLILIVSATRIGTVQRQRRYAALSLVGASKRQINRIILAESLLAGVVGVVLGIVTYLILRPTILANFHLMDGRFFPEDITINPSVFAGVTVFILLMIVVINWWAMRKVKSSPLGVMREQKLVKRPKIWRLLPLILVASVLIYIQKGLGGVKWTEQAANNQTFMFIMMACFVGVMFGLLIAGPYLTYWFSWVMAKLARRPVATMSSRRMKLFAGSIFSSVSGVVLALFVGSFFITSLVSVQLTVKKLFDDETNSFRQSQAVFEVGYGIKLTRSHSGEIDFKQLNQRLMADKELQKMVKDERIGQFYKGTTKPDPEAVFGQVYTCGDLAKYTTLQCSKDSSADELVVVSQKSVGNNPNDYQTKTEIIPAKLTAESSIEDSDLVYYFNSVADLKRAEDLLQNRLAVIIRTSGEATHWQSFPDDSPLSRLDDFKYLIDLIYIGTVMTIIVGGISLAVATLGGFFERQRSFANLRLMGVEMKTLNCTVLVESVVPMLLASAGALVAGIALSQMTLSLMVRHHYLALPEPSYFAMVGLSLVASVLIIIAILPILKRITSLEENRTE